MKKHLCTAALVLFSLLPLSAQAAPTPPVSSVIVMPWDYQRNKNLPAELKAQGFTHATVYLNWSDIESRRGEYEFAHYHALMDALVNAGLSLLPVIDMGGRPYKDDNGQVVPGKSTVPQWLSAAHPDTALRNFSGDPSWQPDFADPNVRKYANPFIAQTVAHFAQRYPAKVLGFAIGLQEEHEIKYGQMGYQWRDYKEATQNAFARLYNAKQPVINYNNNIAGGVPKPEPLLHAHKEFREERLREATCAYADVIRTQGAQAMGYFAETFTSHDAIYATGIVEKLASCIDIAIIDFNFYDGYNLVPDADVLPTLANYLGSLGYKKVMVGAYGERWEASQKASLLMPILQRTITQSLAQAHVMGYEVGGFEHRAGGPLASPEMAKLHASAAKAKQDNNTAPAATRRTRIGILGSASNFYVWHGERSAGRNTHRDALFAAYKILSNEPGLEVHVLGEKNLLQGDALVEQLDAILVPHQAALPASIKTRLTAFWKKGGVLIQDMRLGEFDENGKPTSDWMHEVFGIAHIEWKKTGGIFLLDGKIYRLKPSKQLYTGYASLVPRPGYQVQATELLQKDQGILLTGPRTLAFGFMPQLVEDATQDAWKKLFVREITKAAAQRLPRAQAASLAAP
ncbi:beta-galactosidase [Acidovorax sp. M2(2025)]|uniref:beta-galactosidase n=1 Tax=Acidovorax sp. M2(2025) TaxID=3411355 RepID=UPI003BF56238